MFLLCFCYVFAMFLLWLLCFSYVFGMFCYALLRFCYALLCFCYVLLCFPTKPWPGLGPARRQRPDCSELGTYSPVLDHRDSVQRHAGHSLISGLRCEVQTFFLNFAPWTPDFLILTSNSDSTWDFIPRTGWEGWESGFQVPKLGNLCHSGIFQKSFEQTIATVFSFLCFILSRIWNTNLFVTIKLNLHHMFLG